MKNLSVISFIIVLASAFCLLGFAIYATVDNASNYITEGTVTDKEYTPAWTSITYITTNNVRIPQYHHYPESYRIEIRGEKDGEIVEYWFDATAEEYAEYKIGDYYTK